MLYPHHQAALERFIAHCSQNPKVQAIVVGGSLVKGFGKPSSDLDVLIVVDEAAFEQRKASGQLSYYSEDFTSVQGTRDLCDLVLGYRDWGTPKLYWTNLFMQDSELNWLSGQTPIEDL